MQMLISLFLVLQFRYLTRDEIMDSTRPFAEVEWVCDSINAAPVPECPEWYSDYEVGRTYRGMAYEYGGWDRVGDFLANLEAGLRAGSHSDNDCLPSGYGNPSWATGQDCSGLVSRAWQLPYKHSTRMLPDISHEIEWDSLQAGDIIDKPGVHVVLFDAWAQPGSVYMFIYQATDRRPNPSTTGRDMRNVLNYQAAGYTPMRYNFLLAVEENNFGAVWPRTTFRAIQNGERIRLMFDLTCDQDVDITIFDASGRIIHRINGLTAKSGTNIIEFRPPRTGIYFAKIDFPHGSRRSWRLKFMFVENDKK